MQAIPAEEPDSAIQVQILEKLSEMVNDLFEMSVVINGIGFREQFEPSALSSALQKRCNELLDRLRRQKAEKEDAAYAASHRIALADVSKHRRYTAACQEKAAAKTSAKMDAAASELKN